MLWFNSKRKLKNISLTKNFHVRFYGWWLIISLILIVCLCTCLYFLYLEYWSDILAKDPYRSFEYVIARSRYISWLVLGAVFLAIGITCLGIMTAHRVGGPLVKLALAFDEVKRGNLDYRLTFRKEDELGHLETAFNEMMASLQNKK